LFLKQQVCYGPVFTAILGRVARA